MVTKTDNKICVSISTGKYKITVFCIVPAKEGRVVENIESEVIT